MHVLVADHWSVPGIERAVVQPGREFPSGPSWTLTIDDRVHGLYGFVQDDENGGAQSFNHFILTEAMQTRQAEGVDLEHEHLVPSNEGFLALENEGIVWTLTNGVLPAPQNHGRIGQQHRISAGRRIGEFHEVLATTPIEQFEPVPSDALQRIVVHGHHAGTLQQMQRRLLDEMRALADVNEAAAFWTEAHEEMIDHKRWILLLREALPGSLPHQLLHGDLTHGSFCFDGDSALGLRRMRLMRFGPRILDCAPDLITLPSWYKGRSVDGPDHEAVDLQRALDKDAHAPLPMAQIDALLAGYLDTVPYPLYPDELNSLVYGYVHNQLSWLLATPDWLLLAPEDRETEAHERMVRHLLTLRALRSMPQVAWLELESAQRSIELAEADPEIDIKHEPSAPVPAPAAARGGEPSLRAQLGIEEREAARRGED